LKSFLLVFCYIVSLFLQGCQDTKKTVEIQPDFEAVINVRRDAADAQDFALQGEISVENRTDVEITVISPKETKGLTYSWDEDFEMVFEDLYCKAETDYLPSFTYEQGIYNVLQSLYGNTDPKKLEDGSWLFAGKSASGDYEVIADSNGYIKDISVEEINLYATFEYNN